jgi:hypothetical protein
MDIFMGLVGGFLLGVGFTVYMTQVITRTVIVTILADKRLSGEDNNNRSHDDGSGYWKPKDWTPDEP